MTESRLAVVLYGQHIADVMQTRHGSLKLDYHDDHGSTALSLSMPFQASQYGRSVVEPFLEGLLPDNERVRDLLGRRFGVSGRNPFALLTHMGLDCAGAIQLCPPDAVDDLLSRAGATVPISEEDIGQRLRELVSDPSREWVRSGESWSLAGAQPKIALAWTEDGWAEATGAVPTTHILKPGIAGWDHEALNEHLCLTASQICEIPASQTQYREFDGVPAIVVTRYDRQTTPTGGVRRIHQEDLCQAMSILPRRKYERNGGPSAHHILCLLMSEATHDDAYMFVRMLAFNALIGAPDGHAKNYSLLLEGESVALAPFYDVATVLPYNVEPDSALNESAMAINRQTRFERIGLTEWAALARKAGLEETRVVDDVRRLADIIPDAFSTAAAREGMPTQATTLLGQFLPRVRRLCSLITRNQEATSAYQSPCQQPMAAITQTGGASSGTARTQPGTLKRQMRGRAR